MKRLTGVRSPPYCCACASLTPKPLSSTCVVSMLLRARNCFTPFRLRVILPWVAARSLSAPMRCSGQMATSARTSRSETPLTVTNRSDARACDTPSPTKMPASAMPLATMIAPAVPRSMVRRDTPARNDCSGKLFFRRCVQAWRRLGDQVAREIGEPVGQTFQLTLLAPDAVEITCARGEVGDRQPGRNKEPCGGRHQHLAADQPAHERTETATAHAPTDSAPDAADQVREALLDDDPGASAARRDRHLHHPPDPGRALVQ